MKQILFRADDAGSSHSANRAIKECVRAGVVKNVSFMVPGPAFEAAVELLASAKGIDRGLHVTLNSEWDRVKWGPVTDPKLVPSLVAEQGAFTSSPTVLHAKGFDPDEAMREIESQLEYARQCGLEPDYLDEHMGVAWIGLSERLHDFARRESMVYRPGIEGVTFSHAECVADELVAAPPLVLALFHPSHDTGEMRLTGNSEMSGAKIAAERDAERRFLVDPKLADCLIKAERTSVRYSELAA